MVLKRKLLTNGKQMKISINEKIIKRNKVITQVSLYAAIGLIAIGLFMSLSNKEYTQIYLSYLVLLPAYILMQINVSMANKWGRNPRVDQIVTNSLKGLDNRYSLFHYTIPVSHLLIGPAGIWIIKPYHQHGLITYDEVKKKYVQKGGGKFLTKLFANDTLSDIEKETNQQISNLQKYFKKTGLTDYPKPMIANIFFHPEAKIQAKNAPEITISIDKLKDLIRQAVKKSPMRDEITNKILIKLPDTK
jgi:hypothetical protein